MRMKRTYILAISLTSIFVLAGLFLPELIITYTDKRIIDKVEFQTIEPQTIISDNQKSLIEKIGLLRDYPQNVNRITLEMGTNFDLITENARLFEEISVLTKLGFLPELEIDDKTGITIDVSLYAQKDEPSINGVFWNMVLRKDGFVGNFYIDDNSGKIIQFVVTMPDYSFSRENNPIEEWVKYLGLEVENIQSQANRFIDLEDDKIKVYDESSSVYDFELGLEDTFLPYTFYSFENGYGFGYIREFRYLKLD